MLVSPKAGRRRCKVEEERFEKATESGYCLLYILSSFSFFLTPNQTLRMTSCSQAVSPTPGLVLLPLRLCGMMSDRPRPTAPLQGQLDSWDEFCVPSQTSVFT